MSLEQVISEARDLNSQPREEWPLGAVAVGDSLETALSMPDALLVIARAIAAEAESRGYDELVGASRVGDRLAGAAVATSHGRLSLRTRATNGDRKVLVVDGVLATGAQIARMARELRGSGASRIGAIVVLALTVPDNSRLGIDQLVILEGPVS